MASSKKTNRAVKKKVPKRKKPRSAPKRKGLAPRLITGNLLLDGLVLRGKAPEDVEENSQFTRFRFDNSGDWYWHAGVINSPASDCEREVVVLRGGKWSRVEF